MPERLLLYRAEVIAHYWGGWALALALCARFVFGYATERQTWLLDSQLLIVPLLVAALVLSACLLPRAPGYIASTLLGGGAWLLALSLLPRYGWPKGQLAPWLPYCAAGLLVLVLLYRAAKLRRWRIAISGHGIEWLHTWAAQKPLAARVLVSSALRGLVGVRR